MTSSHFCTHPPFFTSSLQPQNTPTHVHGPLYICSYIHTHFLLLTQTHTNTQANVAAAATRTHLAHLPASGTHTHTLSQEGGVAAVCHKHVTTHTLTHYKDTHTHARPHPSVIIHAAASRMQRRGEGELPLSPNEQVGHQAHPPAPHASLFFFLRLPSSSPSSSSPFYCGSASFPRPKDPPQSSLAGNRSSASEAVSISLALSLSLLPLPLTQNSVCILPKPRHCQPYDITRLPYMEEKWWVAMTTADYTCFSVPLSLCRCVSLPFFVRRWMMWFEGMVAAHEREEEMREE